MSKSVSDLNEMFQAGEKALQSHFAEIRTNILLDTGFHHPKSDRWGSSRSSVFRDASKSKKIRITKNHIQVITKFIRNSIQNRAPDGGIFPANEKDLSNQKSAELNDSVYEHLKSEHELQTFYAKLIHDFVVSGETWSKVFHDPKGGRFKGYADAEVYEEADEDDQELKVKTSNDKKVPVFGPGFIYERIPPYNFITDPDADSERTNSWCAIRKFFPRKKMDDMYAGDEEKLDIIKKSSADKKNWFDGFTGIYSDTKDEVELREFYLKPCHDYPEGYYYYATDAGILEEGTLPDGFCIFGEVFDESPENCRGYSIIKQAKPYQVEINRCAAAVIMESIVLGHSTVMYQTGGGKPTTASIGNGLKGLSYSSAQPPTVIPGRNGDQYIEYMNQQIEELYRVCMVPQLDEDKNQPGQNDAQAMLFRSLKDKMRFSIYGEKIEKLIVRIIEYSLKLARRYLPEDELIPIVGKTEAVNLQEFKNTKPQEYQIRVKPRSDDFSSTMGKSLQISQVLQYAGGQLPPDAIASMVREMPFLNIENMLKDQTVWKDQADAVILSMDRGQKPFFFENSNHEYMIQRLSTRMNQNDFPMLAPEIQQLYVEREHLHTQVLTSQQQEAAAATAGFIPSGGGLVSADYYITTPEGKQQRVRLPYEAVDWLVKRLGTQGSDVEKITNLPLASQAELGQSNQQAGVSSQPQQGAPPGPPMQMTGS